jgi:hypothetical protein
MLTPPSDDAGASTADRYDWQAAMAAADGLALYRDALDDTGQLPADVGGRIVCEHHEDWVAVQGDDAELVSGKHREQAYGAYTTVNQLVSEGGLGHLFGRWHVLDQKPTCRLVTTAGLGPGDPQGLERATIYLRGQRLARLDLFSADGEEHGPVIGGFAQALLRYPDGLPQIWQSGRGSSGAAVKGQQLEQARRFLSMLVIEHGKPARAHVRYAAPGMYCRPILDRIGQLASLAEAVWEAVHALFRVRMRAAGPLPRGGLPAVLFYRPGTLLPGPGEAERELAARIVTLADIDVAVRTAIAHPAGYMPLARTTRMSRLAIKMAAGQCADNSIERAEHLRLEYRRYWRDRTSGDPAARTAQERLHRALLRVSDQATAAATRPGGKWGSELWTELQARIDAMTTGLWPSDLDADLRLGGICELASRCQVWFSDRFDVNTEIGRLRELRGVAP